MSETERLPFHTDGAKPFPVHGWIWVFGSNLAGLHSLGSALEAKYHFGAVTRKGVGRMGRSYAIPTRTAGLAVLSLNELQAHVDDFLDYARENPQLKFFITRVACNRLEYSDSEIAPLFAGAPANCSFPWNWAHHLGEAERKEQKDCAA